jgi:hypothetical protein
VTVALRERAIGKFVNWYIRELVSVSIRVWVLVYFYTGIFVAYEYQDLSV